MWVLFQLDDTNMTFTLYDDLGTAIPGLPFTNPAVYARADYEWDPNDTHGCNCDCIVIRPTASVEGKKSWPAGTATFPRINMVFINTSTGPLQTENEVPV